MLLLGTIANKQAKNQNLNLNIHKCQDLDQYDNGLNGNNNPSRQPCDSQIDLMAILLA